MHTFTHVLVFRVMFKSKTGALKEEFWEDKKLEDEELVKMGEMKNFHSLRGSLKKRPKRKPLLSSLDLLPLTRTKVIVKDPIFN